VVANTVDTSVLVSQNWNGFEWAKQLRIDRTTSHRAGTFYSLDETTFTGEWDALGMPSGLGRGGGAVGCVCAEAH
jgi:hypothetical protein